jgi:hypothetical protein
MKDIADYLVRLRLEYKVGAFYTASVLWMGNTYLLPISVSATPGTSWNILRDQTGLSFY